VCDVAAVVCSSTGCSHAGPAERRARRHAPTAHATMTSTGRSSPRTMRDLQTPPGGGGMRAQERSAYARLWPTTNTRTRAHTHTHIHMHTHTHTRWQHCDQQHLPHARQPAAALMPALAAPARTHPHSLEQRAEVVHVSEAAAVALPVGKGEHLCGVAAHTAAWGGGGGRQKAGPPQPPPPAGRGGGPPPLKGRSATCTRAARTRACHVCTRTLPHAPHKRGRRHHLAQAHSQPHTHACAPLQRQLRLRVWHVCRQGARCSKTAVPQRPRARAAVPGDPHRAPPQPAVLLVSVPRYVLLVVLPARAHHRALVQL
jgi:hypothetical protein